MKVVCERYQSGKMLKTTTRMIPAILCVLAFSGISLSVNAAPVNSGAGGKIMELSPPLASDSVYIEADDPAVEVRNGWYCVSADRLPNRPDIVDDNERARLAIKFAIQRPDNRNAFKDKLRRMADMYLGAQNRSPAAFWHVEKNQDKVLLDPAQGKKKTKTWENCFSPAELQASKNEALRWATYMKETWLPKQN